MNEPEGLVRMTWIEQAAKYGGDRSYGSAIVEAPRDAGWLREAPDDPYFHKPCERRIATLKRDLAAAKAECDDARRTRTIEFDKRREAEAERDEARSCVAASNKTIAAWQNDYYDAKSREASPAMLRVVEAAKEYEARPCPDTWFALRHALSALAAPAVEKSRYEVRMGRSIYEVATDRQIVGPCALSQAEAERIAAVLNDAEAAR